MDMSTDVELYQLNNLMKSKLHLVKLNLIIYAAHRERNS